MSKVACTTPELLIVRGVDIDPALPENQVLVTGKKIAKSDRYGHRYFHTQIKDVATGVVASHSQSTIAAYTRCSCGRVAFHK